MWQDATIVDAHQEKRSRAKQNKRHVQHQMSIKSYLISIRNGFVTQKWVQQLRATCVSASAVELTASLIDVDRKGDSSATVWALPGSSLASSAVLPSSMSKSMSRTVLWSWFRGTGERGERRRVRDRIDTHIAFQWRSCSGPLFGFVLWVRKEASMSRFSEQLCRKT